jgi:hypothetical protein
LLATLIRRVVGWLLFSALGAWLPIYLIAMHREGVGEPSGLADVIATGELMLVSAVLAVGSVGDLLVRTNRRLSLFALTNVVAAGAVLVGGTAFYGRIDAAEHQNEASALQSALRPPLHVFGWSLTTFIICVFIGLSTIWISTLEDLSAPEESE